MRKFSENTIQKINKFILDHPATILSFEYLIASCVGWMYLFVMCKKFGIEYDLFSQPGDFFMTSLRILQYTFTIWLSFACVVIIKYFRERKLYWIIHSIIVLYCLIVPIIYGDTIYDKFINGECKQYYVYFKNGENPNDFSRNPCGPVSIFASTNMHFMIYSKSKQRTFVINKDSITGWSAISLGVANKKKCGE